MLMKIIVNKFLQRKRHGFRSYALSRQSWPCLTWTAWLFHPLSISTCNTPSQAWMDANLSRL